MVFNRVSTRFIFNYPRLETHSCRCTNGALTIHRNFYPDVRRQWGVDQIFRVDNTNQPHLACLHLDDASAEEGLRSSELVSATKLMKQAMRLDRHNRSCVNPVRSNSLSLRSADRLILIWSMFHRYMSNPSRIQSSYPRDLLRSRHTLRKQDALHWLRGREQRKYQIFPEVDDEQTERSHEVRR